MKSIVCLLVMAVVCFSCMEKKTTVRLRGQLKGMGPLEVMRYDGAASLLGDSRDITLRADKDGRFDTIIELKKPEYYRISRNTVYLTPGDDLEMFIADNNSEAMFKGVGAEANNYMKYRLFPKGGSFLEGGRNLRANFTATKLAIDSLAALRRAELEGLKNVSPEFKRLENARILADIANSYITYVSYGREFRLDWPNPETTSQEEMEAFRKMYYDMVNKHFAAIAPDMNRMYKELMDTAYLNVAVVRDVLGFSGEDQAGWFEGIVIPDRTRELFEAYGIMENLRRAITPKTVGQAKAFIAKTKNRDFANEVKFKSDQAGKLVKGQPAIDIVLEDVNGNTKRLSDFKGKAIYLDFWATWCGPCIQESPAFEALSKKYAGKDIVFIPVSKDDNKSKWLSYLKSHHKDLPQYITHDKALKEDWCVMYIPRFILIDKDFNIVEAYAPLPSDEENIIPLLDSVLK